MMTVGAGQGHLRQARKRSCATTTAAPIRCRPRALPLPMELGLLLERAWPAPLRRTTGMDRDRHAACPSMAGRHGAAYRLSRSGRRLFPRTWRLGDRPADADLRHNPATGAGIRSPTPVRRSTRQGTRPPPCSGTRAESGHLAPLALRQSAIPRARVSLRFFILGSRDATTRSTGTRPWRGCRPKGVTPYRRRDTQHVNAAERPTQAEYDRYMWLVERFRDARLGQPPSPRCFAVPRRRPRFQRAS